MPNKIVQNLTQLRRLAYGLIALGFAYALSFFIYPTLLPESTQATAGVATQPVLEISPSNTVSMTVNPGTFYSASQTLSVRTTNYTGYKLTLSAESSADLVGSRGTIPTITLPSGSSSITASGFTNGYGYSLDATNYKPVLTGEGSTLDTTSIPNSTANTYTLTFGAKVNKTVPAGSYTKALTISATANDTGYVITYNANAGSDTVTGMPSPNPQQSTISGLSVNLSDAEPERDGYTFLGWDESSSAANPTYEAGDAITLDPETANQVTLYAIWSADSYTISLNNSAATTSGSTSATATYMSSTLSSITNPSRVYSVSGLAANGSGATGALVTFQNSGVCTSTSNCKYTYAFDGWYTASSGGARVITSSGALVASTAYTNSSSQWTSTSNQTLYSQWTSGTAITLPSITKTGYTCGWATANNTTTRTYESGASNVVLTANTTLYGTCTVNTYDLVVTGDNNLSSMTLKQGSTSGTTVNGTKSGNVVTFTGLTYGVSYYLYPVFASGYQFSSWAKTDSATNAALGSTSTENTYYTIGAGNGALTLSSKTSKLYMQSATSAQCGQTMYDSRDEQAYTTATIGSLCWMTKNLNLAGGTTLEHTKTNVPENYSTTTTGFTNGNTLPASSTSGFSSNTTAYVYNSNSTTCADGSPCYSYYSWLAATAGYDSSSSSTPVNYDICPSGWRLPTQAEFNTLKSTYTTGATLTASPFLGVYGGYYYNSSFYSGGSRGYYWSSTASNSSYAYYLYFSSGSASVTYYNKNYGRSVRCVAQE